MGHALDGKEQAAAVIAAQLDRGREIPGGDTGNHLHGIGGIATQLTQDAAGDQHGQDETDNKGCAGDHEEKLQIFLIDILAFVERALGKGSVYIDQLAQNGICGIKGWTPFFTHHAVCLAIGIGVYPQSLG